MANAQPIRLYDEVATEQPPALPSRKVDFAMLQFRFEVLGEALPTLARENSLNLVVLEAMAKEQQWELLKVSNKEQEKRLQDVVSAANLRLAALKAFREIEKFQSMARLEDAALKAATIKLNDPNISPGQVASLAQVLKTVRYNNTPTTDLTPVTPPGRMDIDITK